MIVNLMAVSFCSILLVESDSQSDKYCFFIFRPATSWTLPHLAEVTHNWRKTMKK
jgi:hypothetical protein